MMYACPCCSNLTLCDPPPGTFEICPICNWEDDDAQYRNPELSGGANELSLNHARQNYLAHQPSSPGSEEKRGQYRRIQRALVEQWDPIGVGQYNEAQNEYDAYIPTIYQMLNSGLSEEDIFEFLWMIETEHMGLNGDRRHTQHFAHLLYRLIQEDGGQDGGLA